VALDRLPRHYGDVLEWKYIEGAAVNEIAVRLGTTAKAAESLLTRARSAFREAFTTLVSAPVEGGGR
ncbi:MAG TPA: sigma factor-like helix-turn-helix DNA-binding protein, partial [Thermoanaerobaculia bacterium]|nr:sigma factor-like helix-turn-helix DNA-binding protein [Thermoanaerobaculia bacterium]